MIPIESMKNNSSNYIFNLPLFSSIQIDQINNLIQKKIAYCYNTVDQILSNTKNTTWNDFHYPLMIAENSLKKIWSPVVHLNSVKNDPILRTIYKKNLLNILEYKHWITHHHALYKSYQKLKYNNSYRFLNSIEKSALNKTLLNYLLSGICLSSNKKKHYKYITSQLTKLSISYANNVLDSTSNWKKLITDKNLLSGIPDSHLKLAKLTAQINHKKGWLFTLQHSNYESILSYCNNTDLRKEFYWAFSTRASNQGPNAGKWDNTEIMNEIIFLRQELAQLLGFNNYFEKSLKTKMAKNPKQVFNFLSNLSKHTNEHAKKEFLEIQNFARQYYSHFPLNPWDITYYKKKQKYHFLSKTTDTELSCYFPKKQVLIGMFTIAKYIFNITIKQRKNIDTWHPDVQFFDIFDQNNQWKGGFYLDLYLRNNKYEGAWTDIYTDMMYYKDNTQYQRPIVYLICNFNPPINSKIPCLLTHNNIITLFHEFGHVLHHILTSINIPSISGIHGVPEDTVEIPSQFMEKLCWNPNVLKLISIHYKTKQPLSNDIINNILKLKTHHSSLNLLKQIIYGLFDFKIHYENSYKNKINISEIFNSIIRNTCPYYPIMHTDRFPHSFTHIFSDDYAGGYYSYLWSDMIASYIWYYSKKKSELINIQTGNLLLDSMLNLSISTDIKKYFYSIFHANITTKSILQYYNIPILNKIFFKLL